MNSAIGHRQFRGPKGQSPSWSLLVEAQQAHEALLKEMARFNEVTLGPLPDEAMLAKARWRLSKASLERRTLSARIMQFLSMRADIGGTDAIATFRSADMEMMQRSTEHVRDWTVQSITEDWAGYCDASREIRTHMACHLTLERELMFPLLERLAGWGA